MSDPISTPMETPQAVSVAPEQTQPSQGIETPQNPPAAIPAHPTTSEWGGMTKLENGTFEYKTGSGQIYRGESPEALIDQLGKAQFYSTRTIAELKGKTPPAPQPHQTQDSPEIDPTAQAIADLAAQGAGFANAKAMKDFFAPIGEMQTFIEQQKMNNEAARFLATAKDYPNSEYNNQKLEGLMEQMGLPPTADAMMMAYHHLKAQGELEAVNVAARPQTAGMPLPPNGTSAPADGINAWTMPFDQLEAMIRQQRS